MPLPLPIVADVPMSDPRLGFERYADALADAIRGGFPAQFTVGIYGPWGSGKSSLLNAIRRNLEDDPNILPVLFDAWRYERTAHIIVPLLHRIDRAIEERASPAIRERVKRALLSVMRSVTFNLGPIGIDPSRAPDPLASDNGRLQLADDLFTRPYEDMREISEALGGRRIVVLIDDLDRCSSDNVVAVLEAINLVMDVPGFIFVLALDYDVLVKAVTEKYSHASGHVFIEKMVQVPVRVPRLEVQLDQFLPQLLPDWNREATGLPSGFTSAVFDVAATGLDFNPRQIKRLINSMLVLLRVAESASSEVDARLLAGVVGLQLRWPDEYRDLADAVFSDDANPTESLREAQDDDLRRYATTFFQPELNSGALRPILTLTRVVASPTEAGADDDSASEKWSGTSAAEVREVNLSRLLEALASNGFAPSQRLPTVYYKAALPVVRVKIGKTVVRIEGRGKDMRWHLGESFLLTTAIDRAIAAIQSDVEMRSKAIEATRQYGGLAGQ